MNIIEPILRFENRRELFLGVNRFDFESLTFSHSSWLEPLEETVTGGKDEYEEVDASMLDGFLNEFRIK